MIIKDLVGLGLSTNSMESNELAPVSSASQGTTTDSSQSPEGSYAFLVQSQDSVSHDTHLDTDNKHIVRQKRRRTRSI